MKIKNYYVHLSDCMKKLFLFIATMFMSAMLAGQDITGQWSGSLSVQGVTLRLVFHIERNGEAFSATLDSPDQGAIGIPCDTVTFENRRLKIGLKSIGATYEATLHNDTLKGSFTQMGQHFPLELRQDTADIKRLNRPQEPQPPFPYHSEEVKFVNRIDSITLAGTLTLPSGEGRFPVVVLLSGSGQQNRDEELMGHKPFWVLADYLTRHGIGVLRYDDRGIGQSTGTFQTATSYDFSKDAEAAVNYLLTRKDIDTKRIGLIGHSEGAIIASMIAARNKHVAFIVLLAGVGIRGDELIKKQTDAIAEVSGTPDSVRMTTNRIYANLCDMVLASNAPERLSADLTAYMREEMRLYRQDLTVEQREQIVAVKVKLMSSPWMQYFIRYNPSPVLQQVTCPVLALNGALDVQVDAEMNLSAIRKALEEGGNTNISIVKLSGLNHLFQECQTGALSEYAKIEQTISPTALDEIVKWLEKQIR